MARALVFPGQGSQAVGMGRDLHAAFPTARLVFEEVDEALKQSLSRLMFEGPAEQLTLTENAQPALMAVSLAAFRVVERDGGIPLAGMAAFVAGHSLGEYSALAAAGTFTLADAARLLKTRGRAMQKAVPVGEGAMAALIGADLDKAGEIAAAAADGEICAVANDNAPGQVVVSGHKAAVERAVKLASERGVRAALLPVSAPFHCPLMAPAAEVMAEELAKVTMEVPAVPLIANVTAAPVEEPLTIRKLLVEQVTGRVRWRESVVAMREREVDALVEVGAGKVLSGLARRIVREMGVSSLRTPADIETFLKTIS
ncbi:MAG TPA: ACP S-malonyltransferase [Alphaproteobacteria bacterium]|nr:ACP S-malonyltransferase [Alphaproteobacteria bacterium]